MTTTARIPTPPGPPPAAKPNRSGLAVVVGIGVVVLVGATIAVQASGLLAIPGLATAAGGTARLRMVTDPPDAQLEVNGEVVRRNGGGPFEFEVAPGVHEVKARRTGHRDMRVEVRVAAGERRDVPLLLSPTNPTLTIRTERDGRVLVDGMSVGSGVVQTSAFPPGTYKLRVESECHHDVERTLHLGSEDREITVPLEPIRGRCAAIPRSSASTYGYLAVATDRLAKVLINGEESGLQTPLLKYPLLPGTYDIRLEAKGAAKEFQVTITAGRIASHSVSLR